jgi:hypothetical protein
LRSFLILQTVSGASTTASFVIMGNCFGCVDGSKEPTVSIETYNMVKGLRDMVGVALPDALSSYVRRSVFPADVSKELVTVHGDRATWSLVVRDGTYFAVSAARCALMFGDSAGCTFVPLPLSVLRCGVVCVRFIEPPSSKDHFAADHIKRRCDFVAVQLKGPPPADVVPAAATWPKAALSPGEISGCSVVGLTNAHPVSAVNGMRCPTDDNDDCVMFCNAVCEGGNSGALLYRSVDVGATDSPLDVAGTPAFMHITGDDNAVKRSYAIQFPTALPATLFEPLPVANDEKLELRWNVPETDILPLEKPQQQAAPGTETAMVLRKECLGHDNVVTLSRKYARGGDVVGVLLGFETRHRTHRTRQQ